MRHFIASILCFPLSICIGLSQQNLPFGKLTTAEKNLAVYSKDPSAHAVVLFEKGNNYFKVIDRNIRLVKEYHAKIKILDERGFGHGTVEIPLYHKGTNVEKLTDLKAVTHIAGNQYNVLPSEIFETDVNERWKVTKFTFPKMKKGCVLEYSYTLVTPYDFNFSGWDFQGPIPKIYSEFNAKIPGNWVYNRSLRGTLELEVNDAKIERNCFQVDGYPEAADCEVLKYTMRNIPAFVAEADFMLAAENYRSRLDFELSQYRRLDGTTNRYTKSWEDVDREFKTDKDIGRQLTKKGFFERHVPEKLLVEGDRLTKAKNIYAFVKDHYTWNERYSTYGKARVKEAFEARSGNAWEINMSLINLLNAADIPTNLMLVSTRQSGLPERTHPIITDFNYILAKTEIDGITYLLDATDKFMPFGMLPFRALNHYGRVMDFKEDSYWYDITPPSNSMYQIRAQVKFEVDENKAIGVFDALTKGYSAVTMHKKLDGTSEEAYVNGIEEGLSDNFHITSYELIEARTTAKMVAQRFKFEIDHMLQGNMVYLDPFFIKFFTKNPFQLEERNYPIDFGHPRKYRYQLSFNIPEGYEVHELPENRSVALGEHLAVLQFRHQEAANQLSLAFSLSLNDAYFAADNYDSLKKLFAEVVDVQKNSLIVLKKKTVQP